MLELCLVMPVYNEEECLQSVVISWQTTLDALGIDYGMVILNDGSRDGTQSCLEQLSADPRICAVSKPNSGHGPTIHMGYQMAVEKADWVFQVDSDDEMSPAHFSELWQRRSSYAALFGIRAGRNQGIGRKLISTVSRITVRALYGNRVTDVNVPFRLIRAQLLKKIICQIPPETFAPNIIISGALAAATVPVYNHPIPHRERRTGVVSIVKWKLWKASAVAFLQTLRCRPRL